MKHLINVGALPEATKKWGSLNKNLKAVVWGKITMISAHNLKGLLTSILEPFTKHQTAAPPADTSTVANRIALLACSLVDPELTKAFSDVLAPVPAANKPGVLDQGAGQINAANWDGLAEAIVARRDMYSNEYATLEVEVEPGKGVCVLEDFSPQHGKFNTTESLSMGKQLSKLFTSMTHQRGVLQNRCNVSGINHENWTEVYMRTGEKGKSKDASLFFFHVCLEQGPTPPPPPLPPLGSPILVPCTPSFPEKKEVGMS